MKPFAAAILILLFFSQSVWAQPIRNNDSDTTDLHPISIHELQNPSLLQFSFPTDEKSDLPKTKENFQLSKTAKALLSIGIQAVRGSNENHPLYSLENAWRYPGPTVQYPTSVSEYEAFLRRYKKYSSDF